MSIAVDQVLDGMPDPSHLHRVEDHDQVMILLGSRVLFEFATSDTGMRNMTAVTLTELRFGVGQVAALMGLTPGYLSTLRGRARDHGSAGLVKDMGRPTKLTSRQLAQARRWRQEKVSDEEIGRRFGVAGTTIARALKAHPAPEQTPTQTPDTQQDDLLSDMEPDVVSGAEPDVVSEVAPDVAPDAESDPQARTPGSPRIRQGVFFSRYAGAMLIHAFGDRVDAGGILTQALKDNSDDQARFDEVALLAATSMVFALGATSIEQIKHLSATQAGPLCGLIRLPDRSTLRPRLAAIADQVDPLALQREFATAMLAADPCTSGVYFVDDHFVPYTGAKPVPKGWDTKHRVAHKGRAETWVIDTTGRAVVFTTGEPSGLTRTLPVALAELRAVLGPAAKIMLGFDRGGAYTSVFTACLAAHADWITYRRAPLTAPTHLPQAVRTISPQGTPRVWVYTDEPVELHDYGTARQITLFEHDQVALQVLTSDVTSCPIALLAMLRARWRIENAFKYAAEHHGIDTLTDYIADLEVNTRPINNPARQQANTQVKNAKTDLAEAERALAQLLNDRTLSAATLNRRLGPAHTKIHKAAKALTAAQATRDAIPAKLPANQINPDAQRALLRTSRRCLQMVLRLLAYNAEHWLATHLNVYLRDNNEYRAITRETILRGLTGTITYTTDKITVDLRAPDSKRVTRALTLLLEEINNTPPRMPGDPRPITYTLRTP